MTGLPSVAVKEDPKFVKSTPIDKLEEATARKPRETQAAQLLDGQPQGD